MSRVFVFCVLCFVFCVLRFAFCLMSFGFCVHFNRNESAVVSIVLPFVCHGLAHFAVHLKNSHRKNKKNIDGL